MFVPFSWIKEYVDISMDLNELLEMMTMSGTKVEAMEPYGNPLTGVYTAKIVKLEKHPNADKLQVCTLDYGDRIDQVVTGATNVYLGAVVPVVQPGNTLPTGQKIKASELRGVPSNGMICSAEELGLDAKNFSKEMQDGIITLPEDVKPGLDVNEVLAIGEPVIEFELTSNRPDCYCMTGIAREIAAITGKALKLPESAPQNLVEGNYPLAVEIDNTVCRRYVASIVKDIKIAPSPQWMQNRLRMAGMRPVNNIVDITNYVMLELGQPLHAFDYDAIKDGKIIVRRAKAGETLKTLDGQDRKLDETMLIIADAEKPVGLAGVMGGFDSEITENTKTMLLESAEFEGYVVRRTAQKLNLRSEASARFEKGLDDHGCKRVADRALALIEELGAGTVVRQQLDIWPEPSQEREMVVDLPRANKALSIHLTKYEATKLLSSIGLELVSEDPYTFRIPTFRRDLKLDADIWEELIRLYGFDRAETSMPAVHTGSGRDSVVQTFENKVRRVLVGLGMYEILTYSFVGQKLYDRALLGENDRLRRMVKLINPLGEEYGYMRTTLAPQMLQTMEYNLNRGNDTLRLFEINRIYIPTGDMKNTQPREVNILCMGITEKAGDFFTLKGYLEEVFASAGITDYSFRAIENNPICNPVRTAQVLLGETVIGVIGEVRKAVSENFGIEGRVNVLEVNLDAVRAFHDEAYKVKALPRFQPSVRDIAILVNDSVTHQQIIDCIKDNGGFFFEKAELFDVYKNDKMGDRKSMAYSITLRHPEKTLKEKDINRTMENILKALTETLGAELRS